MIKAGLARRWLVPVLIIAGISFAWAGPNESKGPDIKGQEREDVIRIESMRAFGKLERAPVSFFHDGHTQALKSENKSCDACHLSDDKGMSVKFKRIQDPDGKALMNLYHDQCIGCHADMIQANKDSGPVTCGGCHVNKPQYQDMRQPVGMDNSLHYRHQRAAEDKCEKCHHAYDEKTQKLFYDKGKEGTCRYCHLPEANDDVKSMRLASHLSCVNCHKAALAEKKKAGPVECAGCHAKAAQEKWEVVKDVPRMKRNQPDVALVVAQSKDKAPRMQAVPFGHQAHEQYVNDCRSCHHASLESCGTCHTLAGTKDGEFVGSYMAMHDEKAGESCTGCHAVQKQEPQCAGCHALMPAGKPENASQCQACHAVNMPQVEEGQTVSQEALTAMAAASLQSRQATTHSINKNDIPENIVIGKMSDQYEAVKFPHRKIVLSIAEGVQDSGLVKYFHQEPETLCQGCHHNSPASLKPPACSNCHGEPFDERNLDRPGLMGAYHGQCMGCHVEMGIEKPKGCTECHKEKNR